MLVSGKTSPKFKTHIQNVSHLNCGLQEESPQKVGITHQASQG